MAERLRDLDEDSGHVRQLRSLCALFTLYAGTLLVVIFFVSDGATIGTVLVGIGGHVLYASAKTALAWREASWLAAARIRMLHRHRLA
jgi:hypothetical protein